MLAIIAEAAYVLVIKFQSPNDSDILNTDGLFAPLATFTSTYDFTDNIVVVAPVLIAIILLTIVSLNLPIKLLFAHTRNFCIGLTTRERHKRVTEIEDR